MLKRIADFTLARLAIDPLVAIYVSWVSGMILAIYTKIAGMPWPIWVTVGLCAAASLIILLIIPQSAWARSRKRKRDPFIRDLTFLMHQARTISIRRGLPISGGRFDTQIPREEEHEQWRQQVFQRISEFDEGWAHEFAGVSSRYPQNRALEEELGKLASFQRTLRTERAPY